MSKFKVGDRVKAVEANWGNLKVGDLGWVIYVETSPIESFLVEFDNECRGHSGSGKGRDGHCFWVTDSEVELVKEAATPTPEPTHVININVTVNNYDNACWYCRKGGLVDLYFNGLPGICPKCGRVMNLFTPTNMFNNNKREEVPKAHKPKGNRPLTNEEYQALPVGTKVFVVWCWDSSKHCKDKQRWDLPGWGVKKEERCVWYDKRDRRHQERHSMYDECFDVYLEEPERPIPEPEPDDDWLL